MMALKLVNLYQSGEIIHFLLQTGKRMRALPWSSQLSACNGDEKKKTIPPCHTGSLRALKDAVRGKKHLSLYP